MKETTKQILTEMVDRYPQMQGNANEIFAVYEILEKCFASGHRLYLCGNGGSASDCEHIAGELLKSFKKPRPLADNLVEGLKKYGDRGQVLIENMQGGLPTVSLCGHTAFSTAFQNDCDPMFVFAQQVGAWGESGDVLLTLSTSGNSKNCIYAATVAKAKNMSVVALLGGRGGELKSLADASVVVPEKETYKVQELHLPVYHCLCAMLEEEFF
ncbi:MAG: SIS domain-containing protein [Clostridia bacterium]|nr:SIS domain-containing protein [Clostridia bacterium]